MPFAFCQIAKAATGVRVAYPAWKPYQLEVSTNLTDAASWQPLTNTPVTSGSQYVMTNHVDAATQTYRLKRPAR